MKKTNKDNEIDDEMLVRFFDAKEAGKSFPDALGTMGDARVTDADLAELHALWDLHGSLVRTAHNTSPDRALLMRTLTELSGIGALPVTQPLPVGYESKAMPTAAEHINNNLNLFMNINWKIVAPVAVVLIAVVATTQMGNPTPTELAVNASPEIALMSADAPEGGLAMKTTATMAVTAPPVSGNVDDLLASLSVEADMDVAQFADASADIALITADSQAITDLSTAYDETTF